MRITSLAALAALLVSLSACAEKSESVVITDIGGFGEPVRAATVEVPASWRSQGAVLWNAATNCVTNKVRLEWQARSRDDLHGFEFMPGYNWQVRGTELRTSPCPVQPMRSVQEFLQAVVQQRRPGARILEYKDRPDVAQARAAQSPPNQPGRSRVDAGQVLLGYQLQGIEFREIVGATVVWTEVQGNVMGGAQRVYAHRAPEGKLDAAVGERIVQSLKLDERWTKQTVAALTNSMNRFSSAQSQAIAQWHAREMARINAEGAADRAAIRAAANRDVARIHADTYANTQATNDRIHRRTMETVGEYNTYRNPDGSTVRSSIHGGQRVLRGADGTTFSTDDPYFNPAGSTELQRVR